MLTGNDSVNGNWTYTYDDFNRLLTANATSQAYSYVYDRFGNRWQQNGPHAKSLSFDANNRIPSGTGITYDLAGNVTSDGTHTYTYDGEGRVVWVDGGSTAQYLYDAQGKRVRKITSTSTVDYIYDASGSQIAEFSSTGAWNRGEVHGGGRHIATYSGGTSGTMYFNHGDWLGTERARTDKSGNSDETCTSLPFGDWLSCTGSDPSPMHLTGKERDSESGLDNFGARYNASSMGRFMTPDPVLIMKQKFVDPQQWNLYSYVRNNPLNLTDPTGLYIALCADGDKKCKKAANNFEKQRQKDLKSKDQKVRDAAKAWGDRGQNNRINVTFKPQAQVDADANNHDTAHVRVDAIVTPSTTPSHEGTINAEFSESLGGSSLAQTIAHEGSHVEDDMHFLNSYDPFTGKYVGFLNFTHFDTEFQAFEAGSMVKSYSMFKPGPKGYQALTDWIYHNYDNADEPVFPPSRVYPQ